MRKYRHLNYLDRMTIELLLGEGKTVKEIVKKTGFSKSTIYREKKLYSYKHTVNDFGKEEVRYSCNFSQYEYNRKRKKCKPKSKLEKNEKLRNFVVYLLKSLKYSPKAVIMFLRKTKDRMGDVIKSANTIYRAIYNKSLEAFGVTKAELHYKNKKNTNYFKQRKSLPKERSINTREDYINSREEFGHWEADCVIGKITNKTTLFVLTERKTRYEIILKLKEKTAKEVVKAINRLEKRFKKNFYTIFKTMTVDNGVEFSDVAGMEKALYRINNRTVVYKCNPGCPHERGTNENNNKLIRKWFPKSADFDTLVTKEKITITEDWMNLYPRELFNGNCALSLFREELRKLNISEFIV